MQVVEFTDKAADVAKRIFGRSSTSSIQFTGDTTLAFKSVMKVESQRSGIAPSREAMIRNIHDVVNRVVATASSHHEMMRVSDALFEDNIEAEDKYGFNHIVAPIGRGFVLAVVFRPGSVSGSYQYAVKAGYAQFEIAPQMIVLHTSKQSFFRSSSRQSIEYLPVTIRAEDWNVITRQSLGIEGQADAPALQRLT